MPQLGDIGHLIQLAVAPVFLLTATEIKSVTRRDHPK
jgi:hypothetical protein